MKQVVLFFTFLWLGTSGAFAQSNKYDVNDDGDVNVTDVIEMVNYILGKDNGSGSGSGSENNSPVAINLGLPSGTKWASCNVGATKPEEYGGYYAWGETEEKEVYDYNTYKYHNLSLGSDISGTEYDVAHEKWGGNWYMPTSEDLEELLDNCIDEWTVLNGVKGRKFTSIINGNSIFLPAAGYRNDGNLNSARSEGSYWLSMQSTYGFVSHAVALDFNSIRASSVSDIFYRRYGLSVRPVEKTKITETRAEAIDLGLPSGTKWASCNWGATKPEEYGGYYAWGEEEEKEVYNENTYSYYYNGNYININDGSDLSRTLWDVAYMKWGVNWCMPTLDDIKELLDNCTSEWTTLNGVNGRKFISKINGNSIFLPAAGLRWNGELDYVGTYGWYWSSTPGDESLASDLDFGSRNADWNRYPRYAGLSLRPVFKN